MRGMAPTIYSLVYKCDIAILGALSVLIYFSDIFTQMQTYFLSLDRDEFAQTLVVLTVIGMLMQALSVSLCAWYFGTKSESSETISINPRWYAIIGVISCT